MAQAFLYTVVLTVFLSRFFLKLSQSQGRDDFYITCPYSFNHVYWVRYPNTVLETYWNGYIAFTSLGQDLRGRTQVYFNSGRHTIRVLYSNDDMDSYWHCCILDYNYIWFCNDWVFIKGRSIVTLVKGTLTLTGSSESPSEGQDMTLSCTTDADIDETKWVVIWFRNNTPVFITNATSSSIEAGDVIFLRNRTGDVTQSINDVIKGMSVASDAHQQNVTIPISTSLIGMSVWSCGNPYISNMSNSLSIDVIGQTTACIKTTTITASSNTESATSENNGNLPNTTGVLVPAVGGTAGLILFLLCLGITLRIARARYRKALSRANVGTQVTRSVEQTSDVSPESQGMLTSGEVTTSIDDYNHLFSETQDYAHMYGVVNTEHREQVDRVYYNTQADTEDSVHVYTYVEAEVIR